MKSRYFQLHHIARISRYPSRKSKERVVNALVTSRLDYCNSLMHGTTQHSLDKLERVQNSAARLIVGTSKFDHKTKNSDGSALAVNPCPDQLQDMCVGA